MDTVQMDTPKDPAIPGTGRIADMAAALREGGGPGPLADRGGPGSPEPAQAQPRIYTPQEVRSLVTLPAETMFALTESEIWLLDEKETDILAEKTAEALSQFLNIDPKKFAGVSLLVTVFAIYGTRTMAYMREKKEVKKEEAKP